MKAVFFERKGDLEALRYGERPKPEAGARQVLIEVHAAGVNPRDWQLCEGAYMFGFLVGRPPTILGSDVSGVVVEVGSKVDRFAPGDEVFGMQSHLGRMGGYAEYVAIDQSCLARKPSSVSHLDAAAAPVGALTAWQALHRIAGVGTGTRVTIVGAAGGVGAYALQFAATSGAHVTAVCGPANEALVRELGAAEVVDYRAVRWPEAIEDQDVVFDTVGQEGLASAGRPLRRGGTQITTVPSLATFGAVARTAVTRPFTRGKRVSLVLVQPRGNELEEIAQQLASGAAHSIVGGVYPLAKAVDALRESRAQHVRGKLVLDVRAAG